MFRKLKTILVVDDAEDQRTLIQMYLERLGLRVIVAEDGLQAVEVLAVNRISLIITDFRMPNMDGASLIRWCRSHSLHIPIILLSSEPHLLEAEKETMKDCCSILMRNKPFIFSLLNTALRAADQHGHHDDCTFKTFKQAMRDESHGHNADDATSHAL